MLIGFILPEVPDTPILCSTDQYYETTIIYNNCSITERCICNAQQWSRDFTPGYKCTLLWLLFTAFHHTAIIWSVFSLQM